MGSRKVFSVPSLFLYLLAPTSILLLGYETEVAVAFSTHSTSSSSTHSTSTYNTPYPPPRFDVFSEKVLGDWKWIRHNIFDGDGGNQTGEQQQAVSALWATGTATEIMRSCGGAVQGIREVPGLVYETSDDDDKEEGYYLNRANDGFLYYDMDGSYSSGPVQLTKQGESKNTWISSISLGHSRICIVSVTEDYSYHESDDCETPTFYQLFRNSNGIDEKNLPLVKRLENVPIHIVWSKIIQCRMPLPNKPWMLQRAKWESFITCTYQDDEQHPSLVENQDEEKSANKLNTVSAWKVVKSSSEMGILVPKELQTSSDDDDSLTCVSVGGICDSTGLVKSVLRQYCAQTGSLQCVAWLEGSLLPCEERAVNESKSLK
jgi:hypothetical protein